MKSCGTTAGKRVRNNAFTLLEIMIAITILALVLASIYSTWTAILRASKTGQQAAAAVQRSRIVLRMLEDSLTSARSFVANPGYYGFMAENGDEASLSFVARLAKSFPRSGRFGDLDVRRLTYSVENGASGRELVLRQAPLVMELDKDEKEHPIVLAKNVKEFGMQFWDARLNDWVDEWKQTNQLPKLLMVTLKFADSAKPGAADEEITRIISLPAMAVQPMWQMPRVGPGPGGIPPGGVPPGGRPGSPGVIQPAPPGALGR
jgi:type II secretion system protein J